jgi:hypothetical protein
MWVVFAFEAEDISFFNRKQVQILNCYENIICLENRLKKIENRPHCRQFLNLKLT